MKFCPTCDNNFEDTLSFCPRDGDVLHESPENLVGKVLDGKYEVESFIAQGGMGAVYRARHILLGDRVVIKILRSEMRQNSEWLRRFQREGRAARSFRHPNAVTVYDMSAGGDGLIYMVMEYVEGHTLDKELKKRTRFNPVEALEVLEPVADALDAAHARGVIHRDMKPDNVMLGEDDNDEKLVKLLDLGIAKMVGVADAMSGDATTLTVAGQILGTPFYMSPEQWGEIPRDGNPEVDGRTDIYSLGVIFFELVAGRKPLGGRTLSEVRNEHVQGQVPDLRQFAPEVPGSFVTAIEHALAKDRSDRPQTAWQFINEVRGSLGLEPRPRPRAVKGDGVDVTSGPTTDGAASQPAVGSEAKTASFFVKASTAREGGRADTVLTSDLELPAANADESATAAHARQLLTNANVGPRGGGARDTSATHTGVETETAVAASAVAAPYNASVPGTARPRRVDVPLVAGGVLALLALASAGGWLAWKAIGARGSNDSKTVSTTTVTDSPVLAARVEAMSYWIEAFDVPAKGDVQRIAEITSPLVSGQHFKFHFTSRDRGYLYIVGPGKSGNALMTFLTAQGGGLLKSNLVAADSDFAFPYGTDKVLTLDDNPGTEEYTVIFSTSPLMSPAFLTEKHLKQLSPAEIKEFEDFRAQHRTVAPTLDVNQGNGEKRVAVAVPGDAQTRPVIFDIRIKHE